MGVKPAKEHRIATLTPLETFLKLVRMTLGGAAAEAQVCGDLTSAYHSTSEDR